MIAVEHFCNFSQMDFRMIWWPIAFAIGPAFWHANQAQQRRLYDRLVLATMAMVIRFFNVLPTGRVGQSSRSHTYGASLR